MGGTARRPIGHVMSVRRRRLLPIAGLAALILVATVTARAMNAIPEPSGDEPTGIAVGTPGGVVFETPTASPVPSATATPTAAATPPTTPAPASSAPTPVAPAPTPAPPPPSAAPSPPPTAAPTPVVLAMAGPEDAVAAFYRDVASGDFDAAYALWSERMKAAYPRTENLDERFDQTAEIRFDALYVAERSATTAVVQANFTEVYDGGSSRAFVGYWELVLVDGRWLLDAPHF